MIFDFFQKIKDKKNVTRKAKKNGLKILKNPLLANIVDSNISEERIGERTFSPGFLNQTVANKAKLRLNIKIFIILFFTKKEIKKEIKKEKMKYKNQKNIIKNST